MLMLRRDARAFLGRDVATEVGKINLESAEALEAFLANTVIGKRTDPPLPAYRYRGALHGRTTGLILSSIVGVQANEYRARIDPGLSAAIGADSFFTGVSRPALSLTVIMVSVARVPHGLCAQG